MNIAIVDDLNQDRTKLLSYVNQYFHPHPIRHSLNIHMFESGEAFLLKFSKHFFDLIYIDCYMNQLTGMDVAKEIRKTDSHAQIIFTTASHDFAIDGYKVKAADYLVKPISYEDFSNALAALDLNEIKHSQFIELKNGTTSTKILLKDIIYCDISGHYTQIHTDVMGIKRFRMPFQKLSDELNRYPQFLSCFRGCIINLEKIERPDYLSFVMINGDRVPFRKKDFDKTMQLYSDFLFEKAREKKYGFHSTI